MGSPPPAGPMLNYEFQRVDSRDLDAVRKFHEAAADGGRKRLRSISNDYLRALVLHYGAMATEFSWARAMVREELERKDSRARRERWLFLILSIIFGGVGGALTRLLFWQGS